MTAQKYNELREEATKILLKQWYTAEIKARAELKKIAILLPTLKDSEEDKKKKEELLADKEAAEKDLKDYVENIKIFEELLSEVSK